MNTNRLFCKLAMNGPAPSDTTQGRQRRRLVSSSQHLERGSGDERRDGA